MISWKKSSYGIKLPGYQVFNRKTGKGVRACDSLDVAKKLIELMDRKEKK